MTKKEYKTKMGTKTKATNRNKNKYNRYESSYTDYPFKCQWLKYTNYKAGIVLVDQKTRPTYMLSRRN